MFLRKASTILLNSDKPTKHFIFLFYSLLQDVVYALAHATGKTGRFTLIERWRNNERLLAPQEHPLKVCFDNNEISKYALFSYIKIR